jgi:two-component system chemotaxis sensor kinase CheA
MSHELRTPLNSILMLAQILGKNNEGNLTAKQIEQTQTIYQSGNDLLNLINDVLDLSKVEAGKMDIHLEDVPLADLTENVKRKFLHMAEGKGLLFQTAIANDVLSTIHTDAQRLNQIVTNLLANAIKFTAEGTVQLVIEHPLEQEALAEGFSADEPIIALRVIDSGIGIPKSKQQLIFEAFQQADGTTNRHYGGTGLGLSISREFSKLLGGKLGLVSEEGKGSTFTLYLPISYKSPNNKKDTKNRAAPVTVPVEKVTDTTPEKNNNLLTGKSILIVDDDQRNSFALTLMLDNMGMTTLSCSSGQEALLFLEKNPDIDIVLMDIMMPGIDGYETIKKIRNQPQFEKLPIVAITAKTMTGDRRKCIEAGANDYLTKPVNHEQLLSVLQVWLS